MATSKELQEAIMKLLQEGYAILGQTLVAGTRLDELGAPVDAVTMDELGMDLDHLVPNPSFPETGKKLADGELVTIGELVDSMVAEYC